jgi:hypothetical protein
VLHGFDRCFEIHADGFGVAVKADGDPNRKRIVDEVKKFLAKKSLLKDPKTVKTYTERLGYFLDWCERSGIGISINSL